MQWRIVVVFLFFISEPVGMCCSAVELNSSCCSCKTNRSPSTQATSVANFLALSIQGLRKGHLLRPARTQSPDSASGFPSAPLAICTDLVPGSPSSSPPRREAGWSLRYLVSNSSTSPRASVRQSIFFFTFTWWLWGSHPVLIAKEHQKFSFLLLYLYPDIRSSPFHKMMFNENHWPSGLPSYF